MRLNPIKSEKLNKFLAFFIVFSLGLMFRGYLINTFYYFEFTQKPLFFSEYFLNHIFLTMWGGIILGLLNIGLLGYIGYKLYNFRFGILMSLLYAISPWTAYVDIFGGENIYILTWILMLSLSIILLKENYRWNIYLLILSITGLLLSSILSILLLVTAVITLYITNFLSKRELFKVLKMSFVLIICYFGVLILNIEASKNIFQHNSAFFYDIGMINTVNTLRGETNSSNLNMVGKLVENKYLYYATETIYRVGTNFSPALFFTPQYRLFDFSFSPPIYLGFIIPGAVGVWFVLDKRKYLIATIVLLMGLSMPSIINKNSPDLSKLIIISPLIFLYISYGLMQISNYEKSFRGKKSVYKLLLVLSITLVVIQVLITLGDLSLREEVRFEMFYNQFS